MRFNNLNLYNQLIKKQGKELHVLSKYSMAHTYRLVKELRINCYENKKN